MVRRSLLVAIFMGCLLSAQGLAGTLTLTIDRISRDAWIENLSDSPVIFDGYGIKSAGNNLDLFNWRSFENYIQENPVEAIGVLGSVGWGELTSTSVQLFEGNLSGETTANPGFKVSLGKPFKQVVAGDISFEYSDFELPLNQRVVQGAVRILQDQQVFPWQNPANRFNVNNLGGVTPTDALVLINHINEHGPSTLPAPTTGNEPPPYLDVNGDNAISSQDVLALINELNSIAGTAPSSVPEPSTWVGLGAGLAVLLALARRRPLTW